MIYTLTIRCRDSDLELASEVTRSLRFSPDLVELANQVVQNITNAGRRGFNGLHLRTEGDASLWITRMGGEEVGPPSKMTQKPHKPCKPCFICFTLNPYIGAPEPYTLCKALLGGSHGELKSDISLPEPIWIIYSRLATTMPPPLC